MQLLLGCCCPVGVGEHGEVVHLRDLTAGSVCCHVTGAEKISTRISFHLKELAEAGLITMEKRGKYKVCAANRETLAKLAKFFNDAMQGGACC
jgi:DNA-binding transcriptional ArsR family regulator